LLIGNQISTLQFRFRHDRDSLQHVHVETPIFVFSSDTHVFAPFIHETNVDRGVYSPLQIDNVRIWVVRPSEGHRRARRNLQVEFVENPFVLVQITKVHIQVVSGVEGLDGLVVFSDIPYLNSQVISREEVTIRGERKLSASHVPDNVCEEMAQLGLQLLLKADGILCVIGWHSQVKQRHVTLWRAVDELVGSTGVELNMGNNFVEVVIVAGTELNEVLGDGVVLQVPHIDW